MDRHPYDLSGGEQQKLALAKLLLLNLKILLLDEPTKGIDAHAKKALARILHALLEQGVAIVMVTHDIEFSAEYSSRCALFLMEILYLKVIPVLSTAVIVFILRQRTVCHEGFSKMP